MDIARKARARYLISIMVLLVVLLGITWLLPMSIRWISLIVVLIVWLAQGFVRARLFHDFRLGKRLLDQKKYKLAKDSFQKYVDQIRNKRGMRKLYIMVGESVQRMEALALNNLGICYLYTGLFSKAESSFDEAAICDSRYPLIYLNQTLLHLAKRDESNARKAFEKTISLGNSKIRFEQIVTMADRLLEGLNMK